MFPGWLRCCFEQLSDAGFSRNKYSFTTWLAIIGSIGTIIPMTFTGEVNLKVYFLRWPMTFMCAVNFGGLFSRIKIKFMWEVNLEDYFLECPMKFMWESQFGGLFSHVACMGNLCFIGTCWMSTWYAISCTYMTPYLKEFQFFVIYMFITFLNTLYHSFLKWTSDARNHVLHISTNGNTSRKAMVQTEKLSPTSQNREIKVQYI